MNQKTYTFYIPISMITLVSFLGIGCSPRFSAYESGPIGPIDPIFESKVEEKTSPYFLIEAPGQTTTHEKFAEIRLSPGEAAAKQALAPPRVTTPGQYPAETFGSAAGQTDRNQPLDPHSASVMWSKYYQDRKATG